MHVRLGHRAAVVLVLKLVPESLGNARCFLLFTLGSWLWTLLSYVSCPEFRADLRRLAGLAAWGSGRSAVRGRLDLGAGAGCLVRRGFK